MKFDLINDDCLMAMQKIPDQSIDMILCDLPYGTTACKWDVNIPFDKLWQQYARIVKKNACIVLFGTEPFSSRLRLSNAVLYKYDWTWIKSPTGFLNAKKMPMKNVENILVFYAKLPTYNPQNLILVNKNKITHKTRQIKSNTGLSIHNGGRLPSEYFQEYSNYPKQTLEFANEKGLHPTQKPVPLMEYLIKTYTNENDLVLDNCMGSGTTGIACINTNRRFIGIEKELEYFDIAFERIKKAAEINALA